MNFLLGFVILFFIMLPAQSTIAPEITFLEPDFEYGEADERYVDNVHFFLFKDDGSAFPVNAVGGKNYLSFDVNSGGTQPVQEQHGELRDGVTD